jgi:hypothetical protein
MLGGAAWHFGWEAVRAWLYEQGFHVVNPYLFGIQLSWILHYGVTLALVGLGLWLFWRTRPNSPKNTPHQSALPNADFVQIEFKWNPGSGSASDPFEINAIVTAKENLKNFALIGHFAVTVHYLSGAKWLWEPSIRLLRLDDFFKGEVKTAPVIRCPRSGNALTVFNERTWDLKSDGVLILLRVSAVSDSGTQYTQKAYNARQFGKQNDFQPISLDDIAYIEGAENPVVTRIASEPLDRPSQRAEFEAVHPTSSALKIETGSGRLFESFEALPNGQVRKTSRIAVTNASGEHLSNCRVQIKYINPHPGWHLPLKLHLDTFSLIAGESKYIELASFFGGDKIRVKLPPSGTMDYDPDLPMGRYVVTLEATADQIKPVEALLSVSVDDTGRLEVRNALSTEFANDFSVKQPTADTDARAAYFQILENSVWSENEIKTTTNTKNLRRDWLEVRLDREIHRALRNSRLTAWGEECLPGSVSTPEKPIPPETWDKVEINFDRNPLPRTAAYFKGRTSLQLGPMAWVGVRFSNAQIFHLFPLTNTRATNAVKIDAPHSVERITPAAPATPAALPYNLADIDEMLAATRRISKLLHKTAVEARNSAQEILNQWAHIIDKKGKTEFETAMIESEAKVQAVADETWAIVSDYWHYHDEIGPILSAANFSGHYFIATTEFKKAVALLPGESGQGEMLNLLMPRRDEFALQVQALQRWMDGVSERLQATTRRLRNMRSAGT